MKDSSIARRLLYMIAATSISTATVAAQQTPKIVEKNDIIYGRTDGAAVLADIAFPSGKTQLPALLMVHGGRWRADSRSDVNYAKQAQWAQDGFFAMNIDYAAWSTQRRRRHVIRICSRRSAGCTQLAARARR